MASTAEQIASQFSWASFGKAKDLKARLLFTLGALIVFRLGTHIPLPGIDATILSDLFKQQKGGLLGVFDMFSGGALERMAIFALSIFPYITASIIIQLTASIIPTLQHLKKQGEVGRRKLNQYTRYLTILLAIVQGYGAAVGLERMTGSQGSAVIDPGMFFRITTVITLLGGTMFVMWLGEQITARGIGNGSSMIIFSGIVARMPQAIGQTLTLGETGAISTPVILLILALVIAIIVFIVFMERAQRRILVQYPKRQVGQKIYSGESSHLPLKLNTTGVFPPMFASSLIVLPATLLAFTGNNGGFWSEFAARFTHGQPLYMVLYGALIVFFCFFCTALMFNPLETAENLRKNGGFVPGLKPGKNTADYFDYVLTRITVVGAAYITLICLVPELLMAKYSIPFYLGGTSLLIAVSVPMDTVAQIHSHMIAHQYEGLIRKSRLKGSKGSRRK